MRVFGLRLVVLLSVAVCWNLPAILLAEDSQPPVRRTAWKTSNFRGTPEPPVPFRAPLSYKKARFDKPVAISNAPGTERMFVAEQSGKVFSLPADRNAARGDLLIDVQELVKRLQKEMPVEVELDSLYGLTFHPQFATNRYCYLCYVIRKKNGGSEQFPDGTRVVRLTVSKTEPPVADPASEQLILSWLHGGHNGGCLKFGKDGMLYISAGDGGPAFPPDPFNAGQDVSNLLSSIMRIDVDHPANGKSYSIPADNPFVQLAGARGEIWAYGLRNPWKMSFDRETGELWVGDVGWELWELVYRVNKGDNFGWSLFEGRQPVHLERQRGPTAVVAPLVEIPHTEGASITGGFVYRGKRFPELVGQYIFGDWETRRVWGITARGSEISERREVIEPSVRVVDFSEDNAGELYLLDYDAGTIHELERTNAVSTADKFPTKLSQTGLFKSVADHAVADGVVSFSINAEQWADGATATRHLGVPEAGIVNLLPGKQPVANSMFSRSVDYPVDTVLVKTLSIPAGSPQGVPRRIETQVLHFDGRDWRGYTYAWNDAGTDADLVDKQGMTKILQIDAGPGEPARQQTWKFASRTDCLRCHNAWPEYLLAFNLEQLNRDVTVGKETTNQLTWLQQIGVLQNVQPGNELTNGKPIVAPAKSPQEFPRIANPFDTAESLEKRARAYLHINCAHCHREGGGGSAYVHLVHDLGLAQTRTIGTRPAQGTFGIRDAQVIAPGDPFRSTLYFRMAKLGPGHMPHIGSQVVDSRGLDLIHDWIRQLPSRPDDQLLLDQLIAIDDDGPTAAARMDSSVKEIARKIAQSAGRQKPDALDIQAARERAAKQFEAGADKRKADRKRFIADLLSTPQRAMLLFRSLQQKQLSAGLGDTIITAALQHSESTVRDLFESLVPEQNRVKRLGDVVRADELLRLGGNAKSGKELFEKTNGVACRNCHKIGDQGTELGPNLSKIGGKYTKAKILENILDPSRSIEPEYVTWVVETTQGKVISGLLVKKGNDGVEIKDAENKLQRIPTSDIESITPQQKSIMPDLLLKDLTAQQVADLLEYLTTQK